MEKSVRLHTKESRVVPFEADWKSRFLAVITDPNIAYILLLIAMYGIFFELMNPGAIVPGVIGVIAGIIALYALNMIPFNYAGLLLIVAATFASHRFDAPATVHVGAELVTLGRSAHRRNDAVADDPSLISICSGARATVLHITGAHCLDNSFYSLHPRRNDRFIDATPKLRLLYPEIDFTEFHFVRHLLSALHAAGYDRFHLVVQALRREWVERMRDLLRAIESPVILFWMADRGPETPNAPMAELLRGDDPLFVDREMIEAVRCEASDFVLAVATDDARSEGLTGKVFGEFERPAAIRAAIELPSTSLSHQYSNMRTTSSAVKASRGSSRSWSTCIANGAGTRRTLATSPSSTGGPLSLNTRSDSRSSRPSRACRGSCRTSTDSWSTTALGM